jgi:hypothetical protein
MEDKLDLVELRTNQSTKKPSPLKEKASSNSSVRKQYDTDVQVANCEYLDAIESFSKAANAIPNFDPVKFPNTLRPVLENVLLTYLRKEPNLTEFNEALFNNLASMVPYNAHSIKKLALNKVLPLMVPSQEKNASSLQVIVNESRLTFDSGKVIEGKGKFSESLREAIFNHVRLQISKSLVERALKFSTQSEKNQIEQVNIIEVKRTAFKEVN